MTRLNQRVDVAQPVLLLIRVGFQRILEMGQPGSRLFDLYGQNAQIVVRIRVIRLGLEDGAVEAFGVLQLSDLMM